MAEKKITVQVTCKDEATAQKYRLLAEKMATDKDFLERLQTCGTERQIYDLYKEKGYTDLSYEDFIMQLGDQLEQIHKQMGTFELSMEELESVVGGFSLFTFITSALSCVPVAGPIISGVAKAIKAGIDGKGIEQIVLDCAIGAGLAMFDAVIMIGTAGMGAGAATAINIGVCTMKTGVSMATD